MKQNYIISVVLAVLLAAVSSSCTKTNYSYDANDGIIRDICDTIKNVTVNYAFDGVLEFIPDEPKAGFVFYPGAFVDYRCYAPLMAGLAQRGFLCVLVRPSFDFALMNTNVAVKLKKQYPETDRWYIGGHSLGGATAAMCIASHIDEFQGLVMLAAYSTKDLSNSDKQVVSIYGNLDGVLNMTTYEECKKNLPSSFLETVIEGGNHSYFAIYGHQDGDGQATITRDQQIQLTIDAITTLLPERQ